MGLWLVVMGVRVQTVSESVARKSEISLIVCGLAGEANVGALVVTYTIWAFLIISIISHIPKPISN